MSTRDPLLEASDIRARTSAVRWAPPKLTASEAMSVPVGGGEDEPLWVARWVARMAMKNAHGCTGKRCRKRAHKADREGMRLVLDVLGVGSGTDPSGHLDDLGRRKYPDPRRKPG